MKLKALKAIVYELAEVSTTQQLKTKYAEIKALDMRQKTSWEEAYRIVQNCQVQFEQWLANPPEEYRDLFLEVAETSQNYDQKSIETKQLAQEILSAATSLEELANDYQDQSDRLKQEVVINRQIADQARLN